VKARDQYVTVEQENADAEHDVENRQQELKTHFIDHCREQQIGVNVDDFTCTGDSQ
jgi:hypothetical protein